jgi:aryl-alcohol dehydrogenase-like predicted oxidoreductase
MEMPYRKLGPTGLRVSLLSYGSWLTFGSQQAVEQSIECMGAAYEAGVNFFDNAEVYAHGAAETVMGQAIAQFGWPRHSYLVPRSTTGIHGEKAINAYNTLNRKYLIEAVDGSLERLGLDHLDLIYCHRPDPETPIEETVWAMSDIIASGKALYWGTSEWSADDIRAAWEIAERHHLRKPVVEQPEYNLFRRRRVEHSYRRLSATSVSVSPHGAPWHRGLLTGSASMGSPKEAAASVGLAAGPPHRSRGQCPGAPLHGGRRRGGLHRGATGAGLDCLQPQREHGAHRGQPGRAGLREPAGARGDG